MIKIPHGMLRLGKTEVLGTETGDESITLFVRPCRREQLRCPVCGARCAPYDSKPRPGRWRATDLCGAMCYQKYAARRVDCPEHGVHVEAVPWARPSSRFARAFEDEAARTGVHCTISTTAECMRVEWRTAGEICRRVYDDPGAGGPAHPERRTAGEICRRVYDDLGAGGSCASRTARHPTDKP